MAKDEGPLLSTGNVVGATNIPDGTLRRYVINFPDLFSDGAKIHSKGRRWTDKDINMALSIRGYCVRGFSFPEIKKTIKEGKFDPQQMTRREVSDSVRVFSNAQTVLEKTQLALTEAKRIQFDIRQRGEIDQVRFRELENGAVEIKTRINQLYSRMYPEGTLKQIAGLLFPIFVCASLIALSFGSSIVSLIAAILSGIAGVIKFSELTL